MAVSSCVLATVALLLIILSGCTDPTAPLLVSEEEEVVRGALVSATEGGVAGLVLDDSLAPIQDATVMVFNTSKDSEPLAQMVTDVTGAFGLGPFPPQTYRLAVEHPGFAVDSQLVQVNAGEVTRATFTLGAVASQQPYVELVIKNGVAGCSVTVVWLVLGGPCSLAFPSTYASQFKMSLAESWEYAVFETVWQSNDAMWMFVDLDDDGTCLNPGQPCPGSLIKMSPIRIDGAPDSAHGTDRFQHGDIKYPPRGTALDVWLNFSDFGLLYNEINNYGKPVCDLNGYCGGVGTSIEIRFTSYSSIFHHALPPAPDQYSAVPDA